MTATETLCMYQVRFVHCFNHHVYQGYLRLYHRPVYWMEDHSSIQDSGREILRLRIYNQPNKSHSQWLVFGSCTTTGFDTRSFMFFWPCNI